MSAFSRSKGRREEQQLVLYIANRGYHAERILRQYQAAGQPDVKATKGDTTLTFEMKSRRDCFKSIYDLFNAEKDTDGVMCFAVSSGGTAVAMSTDFEKILKVDRKFRNLTLFPPERKKVKVYARIVKMKEMKQEADFLVLRDNCKHRLFIRYWG